MSWAQPEDHKFCSKCGAKMVFKENKERLLKEYDTKTGEPIYQTNLGMLVCNKIITIQNAVFETGGHDYFQVLEDTNLLGETVHHVR